MWSKEPPNLVCHSYLSHMKGGEKFEVVWVG